MADNSVLIDELVRYGEKNGLVAAEDRVYVINRLLEICSWMNIRHQSRRRRYGRFMRF